MKKILIALVTAILIFFGVKQIPSMPKKEIPIHTYNNLAEGVDKSRIAESAWLTLFDIYENGYDTNPDFKVSPNVDQTFDQFCKKIASQPKGRRIFFPWHIENSAYANPYLTLLSHWDNGIQDEKNNYVMYTDFTGKVRPMMSPWFDMGIKASEAKWNFILDQMKKRPDCVPDYFSTENEASMSYWIFVPGQIEALDRDPRIAEFLKAADIPSIAYASDFGSHREAFLRMQDEFSLRAYKAFVEGMYKPIMNAFPDIQIVDYAKFYISPKYEQWDQHNWPLSSLKLTPELMVSNASDLNYQYMSPYVGVPEQGNFPVTPYNGFLMSLNQARAIMLSNPTKPFWAYMANRSYLTYSTDAFYLEHFRHLSLMVNGFVFWNAGTKEDWDMVNKVFAEIDPLVGFSDRKSAVEDLISWQAPQIETCGIANRKKVCRTTMPNGSGFWTVDGKKI